jgi:hypothetical protein
MPCILVDTLEEIYRFGLWGGCLYPEYWVAGSGETLVLICQTTRCHMPEDSSFCIRRRYIARWNAHICVMLSLESCVAYVRGVRFRFLHK